MDFGWNQVSIFIDIIDDLPGIYSFIKLGSIIHDGHIVEQLDAFDIANILSYLKTGLQVKRNIFIAVIVLNEE